MFKKSKMRGYNKINKLPPHGFAPMSTKSPKFSVKHEGLGFGGVCIEMHGIGPNFGIELKSS
jgi:hypothetical protein